MMDESHALVVFQDTKIRRIWYNEEWHYPVVDIISALTGSIDEQSYWRQLKHREPQLVTICHGLKIEARDGKQREMDCVTTGGAFRLIQSIPSPKAEPFKQWLARVGYERVQEIENPELAQKRMREIYHAKGYSDEWIEKRVRGITVRNELTGEWGKRGVKEGAEFAILTNEISKATFGKTVEEHKQFKGLAKANLRDHMNDLELIFTMLGEASTTKIARVKNAQGFEPNQDAAKRGGTIAGDARKKLEIETGESVATPDNYLDEPEAKKRKQLTPRKKQTKI